MKTKTYFVMMADHRLGRFIRTVARLKYAHIIGIMPLGGENLGDNQLQKVDCAIAVKFMQDNSECERVLDLWHHSELTEQVQVNE